MFLSILFAHHKSLSELHDKLGRLSIKMGKETVINTCAKRILD